MSRETPFTAGEQQVLTYSLDSHRDVVLWKLAGLDDEQLRRRMTPSGTSLLGLVKHLATAEDSWFCKALGRPSGAPPFDPDDPQADMRPGLDETTADILAFYGRSRAASDAVIEEVGLDALGTSWTGETVSMRWVLVHMIEDTLRHAGHIDILRELIDGQTGSHPPN